MCLPMHRSRRNHRGLLSATQAIAILLESYPRILAQESESRTNFTRTTKGFVTLAVPVSRASSLAELVSKAARARPRP